MPFVTKQDILATKGHLKLKIISVPAWGGDLLLQEMTGKQRDQFEATIMAKQGNNGASPINLKNLRAKLISWCIVNPGDYDIYQMENGVDIITIREGHKPTRMFNDIEVNDLGDLSSSAISFVFDECQKLNGITKEDVDELVTTLKNDQSGDSGFDSV